MQSDWLFKSVQPIGLVQISIAVNSMAIKPSPTYAYN